MKKTCCIASALACAGLVAATPATAAVTSTKSATKIARAIVKDSSQLRSARWIKRPLSGRPAAVSSSKIAGFPVSGGGSTFGLLSTGDATKIRSSNSEEDLSHNNRGFKYRGTRDTIILRIDITAPRNARCLSLNFRFLSEEYPEYIDSEFNDAFIAEVDKTTWNAATGGGKIIAPRNFAKVGAGRNVSVNGAGNFAVLPARAKNTTYDAGTRRLRASTPITPGRHSVYLTIFDQGDHQYDSTVMLDRMVAGPRTPCVSGASLNF